MAENNENNAGSIEQSNGNSSMLTWLVIFLVLLGLVGAYFVFRKSATEVPVQTEDTNTQTEQSTATESPIMEKTEAVTITYKDGVFTPSTVTIKKDTTVKFVNGGNDQMWVASAPHPQHTNLPGFDQLKAVGRGESYEYTFIKVGSWKYHNHVNPTAFGTVVVE